MPRNRKLPITWAQDQQWFDRVFDATKKVAVYWVGTTAESVTMVGYYDTVSAANTAAVANETSGVKPRIQINWWHSDITTRAGVPHVRHPDARADLPSWIDADPVGQ